MSVVSESEQRPAWLVPAQYNDEPPVTAPSSERFADPPIDYSKGPDRNHVFGDDSYDDPEPTTEGLES